MSSTETLSCGGIRIEQPKRRQKPGEPRKIERGARRLGAVRRDRLQRADRRAVEVAAGIGDRQRRRGIEPVGVADHDRRSRVGGIALIGEVERGGALAADQQPRPASGSSRSSNSWLAVSTARIAIGRGPSIRTGRPARSAAMPRPDGAAAQTSISQISGTWSDGRSQLRHGSSTACAFRCPASSGEAHIWSSLRPRSFFVQSGER